MDSLTLPGGVRLELSPENSGWTLNLHRDRDTITNDAAAARIAARWLVNTLTDPASPADDGGPGVEDSPGHAFRVERFGRLEAVPSGERPIAVDQTNRSVVVGEHVVVKWLRRIDDDAHPALSALAHLAEIEFTGVPATFGALIWRTPSGREVPLGFATAYLPQAYDGWEWCVGALEAELAEPASGRPGFPAELGRLTARLHTALATPSGVLPIPVGSADDADLRLWWNAARSRLAEVTARIIDLDQVGAGPQGDRLLHTPSTVIEGNRELMASVVDRLLAVRAPTTVQRIHGDLHVGQVISSPAGLAVIDFDGSPVVSANKLKAQPAARDVAQLLLSLDQVGRIVDRRSGFTLTNRADEWSRAARAQLLAAYRNELAVLGRVEIFDVRLLAPFLVEQACRDLLYAIRFLPRWAYATIDGLALLLREPGPDDDEFATP